MPNCMRVDHDSLPWWWWWWWWWRRQPIFGPNYWLALSHTSRSSHVHLLLLPVFLFFCSCTRMRKTSISRIQARKFNIILTWWADSDFFLMDSQSLTKILKEIERSTIQQLCIAMLSLSRLHLHPKNNENHLPWKNDRCYPQPPVFPWFSRSSHLL